MSTSPPRRKPRFALRMTLMLVAVVLIFGGMWVYAMVVGGRADRAAAKSRAVLESDLPADQNPPPGPGRTGLDPTTERD